MTTNIVIPVHSTRHPMLQDCLANVRATCGKEPIVWESHFNVSVARNEALAAVDSDYICFLDTDAFPQEKTWLDDLVRAAETTQSAIVSPSEIMDFPKRPHLSATHIKEVTVIPRSCDCATMCLLVCKSRVRDCWFDPFIGLTAGRIGPCLEDTDFARCVASHGGRHAFHPGVHVIHKDRGADSWEAWGQTDECLAYGLMSTLLEVKWHGNNAAIRNHFFAPLLSIPAADQRHMASGFTRQNLLNCFLPVAASLASPDNLNVARALEQTLGR